MASYIQKILNVDLNQRSYDIVIGEDLIASAGTRIAPHLTSSRVFTVTDKNVAAFWLEPYRRSLEAVGITSTDLTLPPGEKIKSFEYLQQITEWLLNAGVDRNTMVIALGGGVIGDLAGFAASITLRGMPFIQIPTTLLSQVDSSVGGKTAIDMPQGKNLVGSFYQPRLVLADTNVLDTLPKREFLAGYAEVVKYGLISDPVFFEWCEKNGDSLISGESSGRAHVVEVCCRLKAAIVAEDERESAGRALLNFGHTFAHAFEAEVNFSNKLLHGEAVAIGIICAFELSHRLKYCTGQDIGRVRNHFSKIGLPTNLLGISDARWSAAALIKHMMHDKKAEAGQVTLILTRGIGEAFISRDVNPEILGTYLNEFIAQQTTI